MGAAPEGALVSVVLELESRLGRFGEALGYLPRCVLGTILARNLAGLKVFAETGA